MKKFILYYSAKQSSGNVPAIPQSLYCFLFPNSMLLVYMNQQMVNYN